MKILAAAAAAAIVVVALSGCSAESGAGEVAAQDTRTPTPSYATENQVASVLAENEADWREVTDGAAHCRTTWALGSGSIADEFVCKTREETIGLTADTAVQKWEIMQIPPSMTGLVDETSSVLKQITATNLDAACGVDADWSEVIGSNDDCRSAIGTRNMLYTQLSSKLDAWGPYL